MIGERLAKLEGAFEGLRDLIEGVRHSQNILMGLVGVGFAIMVAVLVYAITRIDNLPVDFERMNQTLSQAIIAAKQQPQQIIVVPSVPPQQSPAPLPQLPRKR